MARVNYKILQLRSSIGFYGAENVILELCKELKQSVFQPVIGVLENHNDASKALAKEACKHSIQNAIFDAQKPVSLKALWQLVDFTAQNKINLVHSHDVKSNFYALLLKSYFNLPIIATCHPWTELDYELRARVYKFFDKKWLRLFSHVVAVSENVAKELTSIASQRLCLISNGIDIQRIMRCNGRDLRDELQISPGDKIIGTIGRLVPEKGYIYLVGAALQLLKEFDNLVFLFIGEGLLKNDFQKYVAEHNASERIRFLGYRDDIPDLLNLIDVFVLPSLTEGLPMVVLEAMAAQKPVIATAVGDIPKVITDGKTGLLIEKSASALYQAIKRLLSDVPMAKRMGLKAHHFIKSHYSSEVMTKKYIQIYQRILL